MKKIVILISIVSCLLFSSCLNVDDIQVVGVERFDIKSMSKLELGIEVKNDSKRKIKIKSAGLELHQGDKHILSLIVNQEVLVPRMSQSVIDIPIHLKLRQPILSMLIVSDLDKYKSSLSISGEVRVKVGVMTKKFTLKEMPVSQFIDTFGIDLKL